MPAENSVQQGGLRAQTLPRKDKLEAERTLDFKNPREASIDLQITLSAGQQDALPSTDK